MARRRRLKSTDMKSLPFILALAILPFFAFERAGFEEHEDMIFWSEDRDLTWSDFESEPDHELERIAALTATGILHSVRCVDGKIQFDALAYFSKGESWVKASGRNRDILAHEQVHFDITEKHARKLKDSVAQKGYVCGQEEELEIFVQGMLSSWRIEEISYDLNTNYSHNHEQQELWSSNIAEDLERDPPHEH